MRQLPLFLILVAAPLPAQALPGAPPATPPAPAPAPAQRDTGRTDVLVLDHLFESGLLEHVRVFLQKGAVYRAEFDHPGVQLEVYTDPGDQPPYFLETGRNFDPENQVTYEVYPSKDQTVELRVVGGDPGAATRLRLYRDARATRRRVALAHAPGWAIGLEVQAGLHTAYAGDTTLGTAGTDLEACFSFRAGRGIGTDVSGCAFGVEFQRGVGPTTLTYFFIEPRFRLFGSVPSGGHSANEGGLLIRGALGSYAHPAGVSGIPPDPKVLGFGVYLAHEIDSDERGDGWSVQASVSESLVFGAGGSSTGEKRNAHFLSLKAGVGRYF